jgi:hypothetical protein
LNLKKIYNMKSPNNSATKNQKISYNLKSLDCKNSHTIKKYIESVKISKLWKKWQWNRNIKMKLIHKRLRNLVIVLIWHQKQQCT